MQEPPYSPRPFGLPSATALVVANMVGAGVFTTSGFALGSLGSRSQVMLAWLAGGGIALCGAVSYGALTRRFAESGGEYLFLTRLTHSLVGFLAGWVSMLAGFTGAIAFAASAFESYALPPEIRPAWLPAGALGVIAIVSFGLIHALLLRPGLVAQNGLVGIKLFLAALFILYALLVFPHGAWRGVELADEGRPFAASAFGSTLVWISLSYSGFNAAVYVAGEVTDARRVVPRALVIGTLGVTALYLVLNTIFLYAPAPDEIANREDVAAVAAAAIGGPWLSWLLRTIICLSLLSSVSAMIVAGPRVYARMAHDGVLPRMFATGSALPSARSPRAAIVFQTAVATAVVLFAGLKELLGYLGLTLSLSAAASVACVFRLGREGEQPWPAFLTRSTAAVFVSATVLLAVLAVVHEPRQIAAALATLITGVLAYWFFERRSPRAK